MPTTQHTPGPCLLRGRLVNFVSLQDGDASRGFFDRGPSTFFSGRMADVIALPPEVIRAVNSHEALVQALEDAITRFELANAEGNPILSAWLPDARSALALAKQ